MILALKSLIGQAPLSQQAHPLLQLPDLTGDQAVSFGNEGDNVHLLVQSLHEAHIHGPQPAEGSQGWGRPGQGAVML